MTKFIPLEVIWNERGRKKFATWYDNLTFTRILIIWAGIIFIFGGIYFFTSTQSSYLLNNALGGRITSIFDTIYFSFITATTTGFGDIVPVGYFKIIAIFEVIFGLILLALVTSKLVSIKQHEILQETYEISFNEKINRIRSSLLVFRQNLSKLRSRVEDGTIRKREILDLYIFLSSLEDVLREIIIFTSRQKESNFKKTIDHVNAELILNSVIMSFKKISDLFDDFDSHKIKWQRDITIKYVEKCISLENEFFDLIKGLVILTQIEIDSFEREKNEIISLLKEKIK